MSVKILFFAQSTRWMRGLRELEINGNYPVSLARLLERQELLSLEPHLKSIRIAVNEEFAREDTLVHDGDEVAILPPVSGG